MTDEEENRLRKEIEYEDDFIDREEGWSNMSLAMQTALENARESKKTAIRKLNKAGKLTESEKKMWENDLHDNFLSHLFSGSFF